MPRESSEGGRSGLLGRSADAAGCLETLRPAALTSLSSSCPMQTLFAVLLVVWLVSAVACLYLQGIPIQTVSALLAFMFTSVSGLSRRHATSQRGRPHHRGFDSGSKDIKGVLFTRPVGVAGSCKTERFNALPLKIASLRHCSLLPLGSATFATTRCFEVRLCTSACVYETFKFAFFRGKIVWLEKFIMSTYSYAGRYP